MVRVRAESSGRRRLIWSFDTTASTVADSVKPRMRAQRISQVMAKEIDSAWLTAPIGSTPWML